MLAEGSKMVVVTQPSAAQGVYGLVANLGGLVVRTAFQPFEEAAFTAFSTNPGACPHTSNSALPCSFCASSVYLASFFRRGCRLETLQVTARLPGHTNKQHRCGRCTFARLNLDIIASQLQEIGYNYNPCPKLCVQCNMLRANGTLTMTLRRLPQHASDFIDACYP